MESQCDCRNQKQQSGGTLMYKPELGRFQYTRHGKRRTYNVTLNVVQKDSGVCAYATWVQFGAEFKGSGLMLPFVAATRDDAVQEARIRIQKDIDNLVGVVE
jgi:hypothetical protein